MSWYWWAVLIWVVGPMIFLPLWYLAIKYGRQGPGWEQPMTTEAAIYYKTWPFHHLRLFAYRRLREVDAQILKALEKGPLGAHELAKQCRLGPVGLYPALQRLERSRAIVGAWVDRQPGPGRRRIYALRITE